TTHIVLSIFVPFLVGGYLLTSALYRRPVFDANLRWFGLGLASAFAVFGTVTWTLTGRLLFLKSQLSIGSYVLANRTEWNAPGYAWVSACNWLLFPLMALPIACLVFAAFLYVRIKHAAASDVYQRAALCAALLIGVETLVVTMELRGFFLLEIPYYALYLIAP